jgi:hypothetical protein
MLPSTPADQEALYDADYYAWAKLQAELFAAGRFAELDRPRLLEEIEYLWRREQHGASSHMRRLLECLIKLQHSPSTTLRRTWSLRAMRARFDLEDYLTPTLRDWLEERLEKSYGDARRLAAIALEDDAVPITDVPEHCPYTLEQVLDIDWEPDNVHGVRDRTE